MTSNQWIGLAGTLSSVFQLASGGVKLKNSSGALQVRNAADNAFANMTAEQITNNGSVLTVNGRKQTWSTSNPSSPSNGDIWHEIDSNGRKIGEWTCWKACDLGAGGTTDAWISTASPYFSGTGGRTMGTATYTFADTTPSLGYGIFLESYGLFGTPVTTGHSGSLYRTFQFERQATTANITLSTLDTQTWISTSPSTPYRTFASNNKIWTDVGAWRCNVGNGAGTPANHTVTFGFYTRAVRLTGSF